MKRKLVLIIALLVVLLNGCEISQKYKAEPKKDISNQISMEKSNNDSKQKPTEIILTPQKISLDDDFYGTPMFNPDNSLIYYSSAEYIYLFDIRTKKTTKIHFPQIESLLWYDNSHLMVSTRDKILIIDLNGKIVNEVYQPEKNYYEKVKLNPYLYASGHIKISPDKNWISFHRCIDRDDELILYSLKTKEKVCLNTPGYQLASEDWHPTENKIVYFKQVRGKSEGNLFAYDLSKKREEPLKANQGDRDPIWSLDGNKIAVRTESYQLAVFYLENNKRNVLLNNISSQITWLPNSKELIVVQYSPSGSQPFLFNIETKEKVPFNSKGSEFQVSSDGRYLVYQFEGKIYLADLSGKIG